MNIRGRVYFNDKENVFVTEQYKVCQIPKFDLELLTELTKKSLKYWNEYQAIATVKNSNNEFIDIDSLEIKMWKHP